MQCADDRLYHSTTFKGKRPVCLTGIFWCLKVHFTVQCADDRLYHSTTFKGKRPVCCTGIFQCLSIHKQQYDSTVEYFDSIYFIHYLSTYFVKVVMF